MSLPVATASNSIQTTQNATSSIGASEIQPVDAIATPAVNITAISTVATTIQTTTQTMLAVSYVQPWYQNVSLFESLQNQDLLSSDAELSYEPKCKATKLPHSNDEITHIKTTKMLKSEERSTSTKDSDKASSASRKSTTALPALKFPPAKNLACPPAPSSNLLTPELILKYQLSEEKLQNEISTIGKELLKLWGELPTIREEKQRENCCASILKCELVKCILQKASLQTIFQHNKTLINAPEFKVKCAPLNPITLTQMCEYYLTGGFILLKGLAINYSSRGQYLPAIMKEVLKLYQQSCHLSQIEQRIFNMVKDGSLGDTDVDVPSAAVILSFLERCGYKIRQTQSKR